VCIIIIVAFILNFCRAINFLKPQLSVTIILALLVNTELQIFNHTSSAAVNNTCSNKNMATADQPLEEETTSHG
jgi:hypothetical protein